MDDGISNEGSALLDALEQVMVYQYTDILHRVITRSAPALPDHVTTMLCAPSSARNGGNDGRSEWRWFLTRDGTLIFGCYPQGDLYEVITQGDNPPF